LSVFARTLCTGLTTAPVLTYDLAGDNASGVGSTPVTWNFQ
jgi:hypothetical protein